MERDFLEKQGLNADQIKAVMAQNGKEINALREKNDQKIASLNDQVDGYKSQIADRDKQLKSLGNAAKDNEELKAKFAEAERTNKEQAKEWQAKLDKQAKDFAISSSLTKAGALENKAVLPFIDTDKVSFDEKGNLVGLQEQLDATKKEHGFLFKQEESRNNKPKPPTIVNNGNPQGGIQEHTDSIVQKIAQNLQKG